MPIYEYRCEACGHTFETLQKVSDSSLVRCPVCGKDALKKLVSASAFRLKGGGWYETDFKTGKRKNVAGADRDKGDKGDKGKTEQNGGSTAKPKDATSTPKK